MFSLAVMAEAGVAVGVVLPWRALRCPEIAGLLSDPAVTKVAHNAPVDVHAVRTTADVETVNVVDTLQYLRVARPDLASFGLKSACTLVGRTLEHFDEVTSEPRWVTLRKTVRRCSMCGTLSCTEHRRAKKVPEVVEWQEQRGTQEIPLPVICPATARRPEHPNWQRFLKYAAEDAETALELYHWLQGLRQTRPPDTGWAPEVAW